MMHGQKNIKLRGKGKFPLYKPSKRMED